MALKAIIVDDDEHGRKNLQHLVESYCKNLLVVDLAPSVAKAREIISEYHPDVVFLDIKMPDEDGFSLLKDFQESVYKPHIVFVTAYDNFAIKAIKNGATDYILKPVDIDELLECEQRLISLAPVETIRSTDSYSNLVTAEKDKISVRHARGIKMISLADILFLEADSCYTIFYLKKGEGHEKFVVSKTLGYFENLFEGKNFFRVHKSYLANLDEIKEFINLDTGTIIMNHNLTLEVSRRKTAQLKQLLTTGGMNKNQFR